jgi:hypothetical protein
MLLQEFDSYAKLYLQEWEKKSTVRAHKRTRLTADSVTHFEEKFLLKPFLDFEEIKKVSEDTLKTFYIKSISNMLNGVSVFESSFVTYQCSKLINQEIGVKLTDSIKQVALAIGTDEMYHALVAAELLNDIKELTGIRPDAVEGQSPKNEDVINDTARPRALEFFKKSLPKHLELIGETTLLCILENGVVDKFIQRARDSNTRNPIDIYIREHLADESRHKIFFQYLLKYIWSSISEDDRLSLGKAISDYFYIYYGHSRENLESQHNRYLSILKSLNIDETISQQITKKVIEKQSRTPLYALDYIVNPMRLMKFAGVTSHVPTKSLMQAAELIQ